MRLRSIDIKNFRNYSNQSYTFDKNLYVLIGQNAQGKTSFIESIYVLAYAKSYRVHSDEELISFGADFAKINAVVEKNQGTMQFEYILARNGKKVKINQVECKRLIDFVGNVYVVKFSPEDLLLIKGSPGLRRKFLDLQLSQLDNQYLQSLVIYNKILAQKKETLKSEHVDSIYIDILNDQLIEQMTIIYQKRIEYIDRLQVLVQPIFDTLTSEKETFTFSYESNCISYPSNGDLITELKQKMAEYKEREIRQRKILIGPHRDDLIFFIDEKNLRLYGSQGQQRTVVLTLILAQIEYIYEQANTYPILLLDDVLSELDDNRKVQLINKLDPEMQTFITTTELHKLDEYITADYQIIKIDDGKIIE
ncbi:DNA replication/repair protein RecF [Culicoidibacter larvae]|uniref:DNA replication and repair protein RecF n=1 Tax=Culicoidibacter larvae TaxID=2579976 RepID=A0A5R8QGL1_9FIRM|nr:DNA replication/repair protein RecF [Culicoidibacter larvae]TLG77179.1 DNA replication/repair protein RecF [Culicoidibacter larvae]